MINPKHMENLVVRPTLAKLAVYDARMNNQVSVELLLGTAAQESDMGYALTQMGTGPGRGVYQMEGATHRSLWRHYLSKPSKEALREILLGLVPDAAVHSGEDGAIHYVYVDDAQLVTNLEYATAMARVQYWQAKDPLPAPGNIHALGEYWDRVYNRNPNKGTPAEFVDSWKRFVAVEN